MHNPCPKTLELVAYGVFTAAVGYGGAGFGRIQTGHSVVFHGPSGPADRARVYGACHSHCASQIESPTKSAFFPDRGLVPAAGLLSVSFAATKKRAEARRVPRRTPEFELASFLSPCMPDMFEHNIILS